MSCLSTSMRNMYLARLAKKQQQLEVAEATYERLLEQDVESYRFDPGDATQQAKRRKIKELSDEIDRLELQIDRIQRKLNGSGLVNFTLRRKDYRYSRRNHFGRR